MLSLSDVDLVYIDDSTVVIRPKRSKRSSDVAVPGGDKLVAPKRRMKHDELVEHIRIVIGEVGLLTFIKQKAKFRGFTPDVLTLIGPSNKDWFPIDAVTTKQSFNRDIGGLMHMREVSPTHVGECMLVLSDYVSSDPDIQPMVLRNKLNPFQMRYGIYIVKLSNLKPWLRYIVSEQAKSTMDHYKESFVVEGVDR